MCICWPCCSCCCCCATYCTHGTFCYCCFMLDHSWCICVPVQLILATGVWDYGVLCDLWCNMLVLPQVLRQRQRRFYLTCLQLAWLWLWLGRRRRVAAILKQDNWLNLCCYSRARACSDGMNLQGWMLHWLLAILPLLLPVLR